MHFPLTSKRLQLKQLQESDAAFIFELLNTQEWKKFIGDRGIHSLTDAVEYIRKIVDNPAVSCSVVKLNTTAESIGILTLIKREYLPHPDIGFAFLNSFSNKGYAIEATKLMLAELLKTSDTPEFLATTLRTNERSIRLLQKLGFRFTKEIKVEEEVLLLYAVSRDKLEIDLLIESFFALFSSPLNSPRFAAALSEICLKETFLLKMNNSEQEMFTLKTFIDSRIKILTEGSILNFEESEKSEETKISGNLAHRFVRYEKTGLQNGEFFTKQGSKFFQFSKTASGWKICALIWEDDKV